MKYRKILLILAIATLLLTACKKEENPAPAEATAIEETTTGITKEQLLTLLENAESVYAENPELFTEEIDSSIFDLPEIKDAELPVLEAITIKEAIQIVKEDNIPEEILDDVAKQVGLITGEESRWDEAITKNEALNMIVRVYSNMETITNADRGYAKADIETTEAEDTTLTRPINEETDSNSEDLENLKMMLEEGVITQEEYDTIVGNTDYSTDLQDDLETLKKAYEMGDLTEEEYKDAVDLLNGVDKKDPIEGAIDEIFEEVGETTHVPGKLPPGWTDADPSQDKDTNIYDVEVPDHLKKL